MSATSSAPKTPLSALLRDPHRLRREHPDAYARASARMRPVARRVQAALIARHRRDTPAQRAARTPRAGSSPHQGSRRTAASSPTSGTDPGDDDPDPDPEPERRCSECGADISHRRRVALTCSGRCRQRRSIREREEAAAWRALAAAQHPGPTERRPSLLPGQVDTEVAECWLADTAGRVYHGRRRRLGTGVGAASRSAVTEGVIA